MATWKRLVLAGDSDLGLSTSGGTVSGQVVINSGTNNSSLIVNPNDDDWGGIVGQYQGTTKWMAIYNSNYAVFGGESGTGTRIQSGGQIALTFSATSTYDATFSGNVTLGAPYLNINAGGTNAALTCNSDTMHFIADTNANGGTHNPFEWWHDSATIDGGTKIMHLSSGADLWIGNDLTVTGSIDSGGITATGDIQAPGIYVGSTNTSYDFYNNGTTYLNGATTIDANLTFTTNSTTVDFTGSGPHTISGSGSGSYYNMNNVGTITPNSDSGFDLGKSTHYWDEAFIAHINSKDFINIQIDDAEQYFQNTAGSDYWRLRRDASNNFILDHYDGSSTGTAMSFDSSENLTLGGTLVIPGGLKHSGDTGTYLAFTNGQIDLKGSGGVRMMLSDNEAIYFYTGSSTTQALHLDTSQNATFGGTTLSLAGTASVDSYLRFDGTSGDTYLHYNANDIIDVYTGGDIAMRIKDDDVEFNGGLQIDGNVQIGTAGNDTSTSLRVNTGLIIHKDSGSEGNDVSLTFDRRSDGATAYIKATAGDDGAYATNLSLITKGHNGSAYQLYTGLTIDDEGRALIQGGTPLTSEGVNQRLKIHGSGDNYVLTGCYDDNGWGYFNSYNNANGIQFYTGTGAFFFNNANVGIGISSPNKQLTVALSQTDNTIMEVMRLTTTGSYDSGGSSNAGASLSFGQYADTYPDWQIAQIAGIRTGNNWGGSLVFHTNSNSAQGDLSEKMRIDSSGNVGIGTTSPDSLLHIEKAGGATLRITNSSDGASDETHIGTIEFEGDDESTNRAGVMAKIVARYSDTGSADAIDGSANEGGSLGFYTSIATSVGGSQTLAEKMRIENNGNVGIGTSSPDTFLHIHKATAGSITAHSDAQLSIENSGVTAINLLSGTTSHGQILFGDSDDADKGVFGYDQSTDKMYIRVNGSNTKTFVVNPTGTGIGTDSPLFPLHVSTSTAGRGLYVAQTYGTGTVYGGMIEAEGSSTTNIGLLTKASGATNNYGLIVSAGSVGIGTTSPAGLLHIQSSDSTTDSEVDMLTLTALSTGTTTTGFGPAIKFQAERNNGVNQNVGKIISIAEVNSGSNISSGLAFETGTVGVLGEKMRITYDGKVGIGTTAPDTNLHVHKATAGTVDSHSSSVLTLENNSSVALQFLSPNSDNNIIYFGDVNDNDVGYIVYQHGSNTLGFVVNGSEAIAIGSDGKADFKQNHISNWNSLQAQGGEFNIDNGGYIDVLGTKDLTFRTTDNNYTRMVIKSGGAIGIGDDSPSYKLDIAGDYSNPSATAGATAVMGISAGASGSELVIGGEQSGGKVWIQNRHKSVNGYAYEIAFQPQGGTTSFGGPVGLGATPSTYHASADNLVIYESANAGMTIATSSTGTGSIFFADSGTGDEAYKGVIEYNHSTNELQFRANSVVGMTLNPSKNLTVEGSGDYGGDLTLTKASGDLIFRMDNNVANSGDFKIRVDAGSNRTDFYHDDNHHLCLKGQKVGIMTTSPSAHLHVNGDMLATGTGTHTFGVNSAGGGGVLIRSLYDDNHAKLTFSTGHPNNALTWDTGQITSGDNGNYNGIMTFYTSGSEIGTGLQEAMSLNASQLATFKGDLVIDGRTKTAHTYLKIQSNADNNYDAILQWDQESTMAWQLYNDGSDSDKLKLKDAGGTQIFEATQDSTVVTGVTWTFQSHTFMGDIYLSGGDIYSPEGAKCITVANDDTTFADDVAVGGALTVDGAYPFMINASSDWKATSTEKNMAFSVGGAATASVSTTSDLKSQYTWVAPFATTLRALYVTSETAVTNCQFKVEVASTYSVFVNGTATTTTTYTKSFTTGSTVNIACGLAIAKGNAIRFSINPNSTNVDQFLVTFVFE